jgi:maltose O-acetyltransferase
MRIGEGVALPPSTWIDVSHCFLISIGDRCGFAEECIILAHDAQMNEFLDATRVGRVVIHSSCHIGARTIILPGVEIGPRTIVGAGSVVSKSLPPETVCAGNPARALCSLDEYLSRHRELLSKSPTFDFMAYNLAFLTRERKAAMVAALEGRDGYITGGFSSWLRGEHRFLVTPAPPRQSVGRSIERPGEA